MSPRRRSALPSAIAAGLVVTALAFHAREAEAAPPWVDRDLTLPRGDWAFNFGLGVAHDPDLPGGDTAAGLNAEMAVGVTRRVELGLRTGIRLGDALDRSLQPDFYGRLFDRQTFGTGIDTFANPEFRVTGEVARGEVAEVALEGRVVLPFETGTTAAFLFGIPLAFHLGNVVRLDTGGYFSFFVPNDNRDGAVDLSIPIDVWIQASNRVFLGPMAGLVVGRLGQQASFTNVQLGFGMGVGLSHAVDFKAQLLFPDVNERSAFGLGAGVEVRIE